MSVLLTIALMHAAVLVIPGPDVLLVSQTAVSRSRRAALLAGLGVSLSIGVWAGFALLGVGVLFQAFPWIHTFIKLAGGLYLLWMGLNLWRSSCGPEGEGHAVTLPLSDFAALRTGFLTNISNPKAAVFFGSVFSSVLGAHADSGVKFGAWLIVFGLSLLWFALVAYGLSTSRVQAGYLRARKAIDRVGGTLMLGFGGLLLASRE